MLQNHHYYIITDSKDKATQDFCNQNGINCWITDTFYDHYEPFNKARAINSFFKYHMLTSDHFEYILLLDSDCIIDNVTDFRSNSVIQTFIDLPDKNIDCLYSCGRRIYNTINDYNNTKFIQGGCNHLGFFQLFHKSKNFFNQEYLFEFRNASVYDCEFAKKFNCQRCIPVDVDHIGPIYINWEGRHPRSNVWM